MEQRRCILIPLLLCLVSTTSGTPEVVANCLKLLNHNSTTDRPIIGGIHDAGSLSNLTDKLLGLHHVQRRHAVTPSGAPGNKTTLPIHHEGNDVSDVFRLATILPADVLSIVRMLTVPVLNMSLGVPANLLEQLSNSSFIGELNGEGLMAGLSGLQGNASRWLHSNGSSPFSGSGIGNLSFPRIPLQFPLFQADTNTTKSTSPHDLHEDVPPRQNLFNATKAGSAAHSAALFGERLILTPVASLLQFAVSGGHGGTGPLPATLNPDHLQRHLAHLTQFLGAAREQSTVAPKRDDGVSTTTGRPRTTP